MEQVRVDERGEQVVGRGDGVKIPVEMEIDLRAGLDLRKAAAGRASSPAAVGVVAVTRISLPRRLKAGSDSSSSLTLPLAEPRGSKYLSGISSLRAIA